MTLPLGNVQAAQKLKFAHVYEVGHPLHQGALMAAEQINQATEGRYEVEVFPASSLGKEAGLNEGLTLGTVDIIYTGAGFAGSIYGPISITDFPFTLRNLDHWKAYGKSDLFKEISKGFEEASGGSVVGAISYYGTRHVTSNKPILTPADIKDVKIRVPNAPAYVLFPKAAGSEPNTDGLRRSLSCFTTRCSRRAGKSSAYHPGKEIPRSTIGHKSHRAHHKLNTDTDFRFSSIRNE